MACSKQFFGTVGVGEDICFSNCSRRYDTLANIGLHALTFSHNFLPCRSSSWHNLDRAWHARCATLAASDLVSPAMASCVVLKHYQSDSIADPDEW